jgi:hypothetical protein
MTLPLLWGHEQLVGGRKATSVGHRFLISKLPRQTCLIVCKCMIGELHNVASKRCVADMHQLRVGCGWLSSEE